MTVQLVKSLDFLLYPCFVLCKLKQISLLHFYYGRIQRKIASVNKNYRLCISFVNFVNLYFVLVLLVEVNRLDGKTFQLSKYCSIQTFELRFRKLLLGAIVFRKTANHCISFGPFMVFRICWILTFDVTKFLNQVFKPSSKEFNLNSS